LKPPLEGGFAVSTDAPVWAAVTLGKMLFRW